jgi:hypothetical protein
MLAQKFVSHLKRRIVPDQVRELARQLIKFIHNNPLVVLDGLVSTVQYFDNLAEPMVEALKFTTPLGYDVFMYLIMCNLCDPSKQKIQDDGFTPQLWFQSLCCLTGSFLKRYSEAMLTNDAFFHYVKNQLRSESSSDLLVLNEILTQMTGVILKDNMSVDQILGQAGGRTLRSQTLDAMSFKERSRKQLRVVKQSMLQNNLLLTMLILVTQQKAFIVHRQSGLHLKARGDWLDRCQDSLVQIMEFVSTHVEFHREYAPIMCSFQELHRNYFLSLEDCFFILRPLLHHPRIVIGLETLTFSSGRSPLILPTQADDGDAEMGEIREEAVDLEDDIGVNFPTTFAAGSSVALEQTVQSLLPQSLCTLMLSNHIL